MRIFKESTLAAFLLVATFEIAGTLPSHAETQVASWNTLQLGWNNGKDVGAMAQIAGAFDLIALQEVMSPDGLGQLEAEVEAITGESWTSMASEAIGRGSYKEHYAFLWRDSEVTWIDGAVVYIDDAEAFAREPMSARFETADGYQFVLASVHLIYGDDVARRQFEADALADYQLWLAESFPGTPIYIAGDFNLPPSDPAWNGLGSVSSPLITSGATTLSKANGKFANLYDNIWAPAGIPVPLAGQGIMDFPRALGIDHMTARDIISDHAPVYMTLDPSVEWVTLAAHSDTAPRAGRASPAEIPGAEIRANRNSMIYHLPDCPSYAKVSAKNLETFTSESEARSAGYKIAGNCPQNSK